MDDLPNAAMAAQPKADILAEYTVPDSTADELFDADGQMRPVWAPLIQRLQELSSDEIEERIARGDQYLRDAGVYFRRYSDQTPDERDWPLSHIPVLLPQSEWDQIAAGLTQRADILERIVADIYGDQSLVKNGHLPASLLAKNPEWLRPMMGIVPQSGHFLHHLAFEIGRNPDGSWFVLGDRTQAPSGAGFALENRRATSRVFPGLFANANIHRLAGFFRDFQTALGARGGKWSDPPAILTPGPGTDTYFEHVYIARYLGLMLLEGEDLTVSDGQAMVRTVDGLKPVSLLWRRLDARFADPLELDETSQIGTPGLVNAARTGRIRMVNALGSGVLESRAMMAFIPRIADSAFGTPLHMPNIATWWCGSDDERAYVARNAHRMTIGPALTTSLPFDASSIQALAGHLRAPGSGPLSDWIDRENANLVAQEAVTLSTTPAYADGRLQARPMTVRVFMARTPNGWSIMPGGYARIGLSGETTALTMQRGGAVSDVWVVSDAPVDTQTLAPANTMQRRPVNPLPSRAADNLYWLGRYVERTEATIRLLRAYHLRLEETGSTSDVLVALIEQYLARFGTDPTECIPETLSEHIDAATSCASKVRDRFSVDGWIALRDLRRTLSRLSRHTQPGQDCVRAMDTLLRMLSGFAGLVQDNMYRSSGWRFLEFGRSLERAQGMAGALAYFAEPDAPEGSVDIAIELGDSVITHQRRYLGDPCSESVVDLLALDRCNPRSIRFQLETLRELLEDLPNFDEAGRMPPLAREALRLHTDLAISAAADMTPSKLISLSNDLARLSNDLSATYFK
ncbi:MAG: circularly permuted type 2 ATP-grasp protein [Thalassovita sp.]